MKKILAILMALAMIFSLAACGEKDKEEETKASETQAVVNDEKPVIDEEVPTKADKPVNLADEEAAIKKAAEDFVDLMFISEDAVASDLVDPLSYVMKEYVDTTYGTAEMREEFEAAIDYDLDTYIDAMGVVPDSDDAKMSAMAAMIFDTVFGDWTVVGDVIAVEIISTDVETDEELTGDIVEMAVNELANEMGVDITGGPEFSAIADAEVSLSVEYADGTTSVEYIELGMLKEDGQWKVFPIFE